MISHTMLGTNDLTRSEPFYTELLGAMGGRQIHRSDEVAFWEFEGGASKFALTLPFDGESATVGNGSMVAFVLPSAGKVDEVFAMALRLGGVGDGDPGTRSHGAYCAYFRDLDGNKIAIFHR